MPIYQLSTVNLAIPAVKIVYFSVQDVHHVFQVKCSTITPVFHLALPATTQTTLLFALVAHTPVKVAVYLPPTAPPVKIDTYSTTHVSPIAQLATSKITLL